MSYSLNNPVRLTLLVEKLRQRLKNFAVIDSRGERLGEVKDLVLDAKRQLNLVVSHLAADQAARSLLIVSKVIKKIEPANKAVFLEIDKADIANLSEYTGEISLDSSLPGREPVTAGTRQDSDRIEDSFMNQHTDTTAPLFETRDMHNEVQTNIHPNSPEDTRILGEEVIRLLGERLVVERNKRKVGEVIVRKEIETRMVQVPVRYEKLIVEQVSPEFKQLAEIELGQEAISQDTLSENAIALTQTTPTSAKTTSLDGGLTVSGTFNSPKIASLLLNAIALERQHGCKLVRVEIVVEDAERQKTYQEWFDRSSAKQ